MKPTACRWAIALGGLALCVSLTACGVTLQDAAEPLPSNVMPKPPRIPTPEASTSSSSAASELDSTAAPTPSLLRLWFVQDDGLVAVESDLPVDSPPDLVLQSLAAGPTADQAAEGLRTVARDPLTGQALAFVADSPPTVSSALTPSAVATGVPQATPSDARGARTVILSQAFSALPPSEQVLLLGQVVLSLSGLGEELIAFTDDLGSLVAVPLPDGRLLDTPARARDYARLIIRL